MMNQAAGADSETSWHTLDSTSTAAALEVDPVRGLSAPEVQERLARYGENRLAEQPPRSKWLLLADQFKNLLVVVLLGAAVLAGSVGNFKDTIVILVVVVINAILGFWQEYRAEATLAALKQMLSPTARVRRGGSVEEIPATELALGDIALLEAGDRVPADGRLWAAHSVEIDEAALTGESLSVAKDAAALAEPGAPLAERIGMVYMNSVVTRGRAEMIVTATGMATEMGRISGMLAETEPGPTPLQRQLDVLGKRLALIAGVVVSFIFALGLFRGEPLVQIMLTSIALAVAAIPEGLPVVVTVTLALGMNRMAQHKAIVKRLAAVETLGCTTAICSDKTGTLTLNQMTARGVYYRGAHLKVTGEGYGAGGEILSTNGAMPELATLLAPAALANDSRVRDGKLLGDPTEGALLSLASRGGVDIEQFAAAHPRLAEIPFESEHKFMATFHAEGDSVRMYVKGAPDVLLERATNHITDNGVSALDEVGRVRWAAENERFAGQAMRVLALATKSFPKNGFDPAGDLMTHASGLTLVGLVGIIDPPRPEARDAIALCKKAGIRVRMITGDHKLTAAAIAKELGMEGGVMEGRELDTLSDEELTERIPNLSVFARVAPEHKVRIVRALKERGEIVAMTGDGVNDAPALKSADIGVAMGITGTEVTKEAATMILTDDNFATIVRAVKEGRAIYDNIVKFVRFQLSTNMGAIQTVVGSSLLGWPIPFTPIQILWVNIIMDGPPAMSLGVEPARPGVMNDPPRLPDARILTPRRLVRLMFFGFIMAVGTLWLFNYGREYGGADYGYALAFTAFVLFQFFNVLNARAEYGTTFNRNFFRNRWLWISLTAVVSLQILVVHWGPAQPVFNTTDLTLAHWGLAIAVASSVLVLEELRKLVVKAWVALTRSSQAA